MEVYTMPVIMKKVVRECADCVGPVALRQKIIDMILRETSTIGVRWQESNGSKRSVKFRR
jgi:hypothetical protein